MSSRSTRKATASVIDVPDQQNVSDPEPAAADIPVEQDATPVTVPAESPASD